MARLAVIGAIGAAVFAAHILPASSAGDAAEPPKPAQGVPGVVNPGSSAALTTAQGPTPSCSTAKVDILPRSTGRADIIIQSDCRQSEPVRLQYAGVEFVRRIDATGRLEFILDCFAGDSSDVTVVFADGSQERRRVVTSDLDRVTKLAIIWKAPVNLDLHAFEYSAPPQSPDHVWSGAPLGEQEARRKVAGTKRGHGFLSSISDGTEPGAKLEVYTFLHAPGAQRGVISMALDYESRARPESSPDTCGTGLYAELEYEAFLLERQKAPVRLFRKFSSLNCTAKLSGIDRLNHKTVPEIILKN